MASRFEASITEEAGRLRGSLGHSDRAKLGEYLEAIRDIERRLHLAEEQRDRELPSMDRPAGIPADYDDHINLMFDLMLLAYQTDMTRVITFMLGREFSGMTYPQIGVPDAHHPVSHHAGDADKIAKMLKVNQYHASLFARLLERMRATPDGDGTLLDHTTMMYGYGMRRAIRTRRPTFHWCWRAGARARSRAAATSGSRTLRWRTCT